MIDYAPAAYPEAGTWAQGPCPECLCILFSNIERSRFSGNGDILLVFQSISVRKGANIYILLFRRRYMSRFSAKVEVPFLGKWDILPVFTGLPQFAMELKSSPFF